MVESIPRRLVFRIPGVALVGVLFGLASMSVLALAGPKLLLLTYLIPILIGVWVVRTRTVVDTDVIRVRRLFTARRINWSDLAGLRVQDRKWVRAVLADGDQVTLPCVKLRHLPVLSLLSGGRLPDPTEPPSEAEGNDEAPVPSETGATA
ncbi:MAG TPA: PH domain-containing protein [Pseudonocardiaceae bacterium]